MSARPAELQPVALVAAVAGLELALARLTGGPVPLVHVGAAIALAAMVALALAALRGLPARWGAFGAVLVPLGYGAWTMAGPLTGRLPWAIPAGAVAGSSLVFVNARVREGRGPLRPRHAVALYAGCVLVTWAILAAADARLPPSGVLVGATIAAAAAVAADRYAGWLALVALVPALPGAGWSDRPAVPGAAELPDVLLITVDTLRLDAAKQMASYQRLAREGTAYDAQAAAPWTLPSLAAIHTGLEPHRHRAGRTPGGFTGLPGEHRTLAERLASLGFDTAATVESPFCAAEFGLQQGFDRFRLEKVDRWVVPGAPYSNHPRPLAAGVAEAAGLLAPRTGADARVADARTFAAARRPERPLFTWVHLLDPHIPYRHADELGLPAADTRLLATAHYDDLAPLPDPRTLELLRKGYDHEIEVADAAILAILDSLPDRGRGRIVVLVSDHGEAFGEHGGWEHGHTLYQELLAVPLVVAGVDGLRPGDAGQVDVAATLLAALGVPADGLDGRDLRGLGFGTPYRSVNPLYGGMERRAVKVAEHKLIADGDRRFRFDLAADPEELAPLVDDGRMEALLPPPGISGGTAVDVDGEVRSGLEALGYLEREE